jgi:transcriptional antiterminator RfaH
MKWYCLHTEPKQESKVAIMLNREHALEVFSPRIRFRRMRAGRPLWAKEALFPGYLFARFNYEDLRHQVNGTPGVTRVVRFGDRPIPVEEAVMTELRSLVKDDETVEVTADPQPGSEVIVAGGAMRGLRALVTRVMPARQRIAILLELLGNTHEVEIETERVLPVNPRTGKG